MTLEEIAAVDRNGYRRGWLECKERVLKIEIGAPTVTLRLPLWIVLIWTVACLGLGYWLGQLQ